jgi:hypothetical protein
MCGHGVMGATGSGLTTQQYATQTGTTTQVAGASGAGVAGHEGHGHATSIIYNIKDNPPNAGQFITGSLGASAGKDFKLDKGAGFHGKKGRNPNGNDQKQNNLTKADANRPAYGIPKTVAGTNQKPNYVQDIQVSIGMGGLEALRPDVLQKLIDQQNAGHGSVWNGVAYLTGLNDKHDGSVTPELEAMRSEIMNTKVGNSGKTLAQWAENPKDSRGNNWARSNHAMTGIKAYLQMEKAGIPSNVANKLANNDDMVSGAGRIDQIAPGRASNNQENTFTGMNAAERKQWEKAAAYARESGHTDALRILMDSHTMGSHMLTQYGNKGAKSKINKNLGLDPNMPTEQRKQALVQYFLNNPKDPKQGHGKDEGKAAVEAAKKTAAAEGGGGNVEALKSELTKGLDNLNASGAQTDPMAGCPMMNAKQGPDLLGGGPDMGSIGAILQQLQAAIQALVTALSASGVAGLSGGGPVAQKDAVQGTQLTTQQTTQQNAQQGAEMVGHSH